jgi:CheY-like chemotaxis protein
MTEQAGDRASVLVVEDDPDIRALLEQRVRRLGHEVVSAATAEAGLVASREHRPDLVLLDLKLPGMDGWAFLDQLRAEPDRAGVPVVVVSIVDRDDQDHPAVDAYLTKPFRTAAVDELLHRYLDPTGAGPS